MTNRSVKVPVIMQMEALECGAACLAMILAYNGRWVPLEQVRADCGVSRDGSKASNMVRAAESHGLAAEAFKLEPGELRAGGRFPCIIHWNFNHFVVLCGFRGNYALINDPGRGSIRVSMDEFDRCFTGVTLFFTPTADFERGGKPKSVLAFARQRLSGTLVPFIFVVITGIITAVLGIIQPAFSRVFVDRLLSGKNPDWLYPFIGGLCALLLVQVVVSLVNTLYMLKIQGKLAIVANTSFMWHVLRLPMEFFSQRMAGDVASRQSSNESIAITLIKQLAPVFLNLAMMVFYLVVMLRYSPLLTAIGIAFAVLDMFLVRVISKKRINITRVLMRDSGKLSGFTVSGISMIETIKSAGAEDGFFEKWAGYQASVNTSTVKSEQLNRYWGSLPRLLQSLSSIAILVTGAALIMESQFTAGMMLAFQGFMASFLAPVNSLVGLSQSVQEMRTSMERIDDVMSYKTDVEFTDDSGSEETISYSKLSGALEMRGVTFGYSKLEPPLIRDFSLKLEPGAKVAFVGTSGCGKSTLSKLISGLYKPWSGEILFDGRPREEIDRDIFTGSVAVVDQDILLFEDTIANNIKMWDSSIEDFEMIMAARDAQIHADILRREGGYNYKLLEGGRDFSGGQRQRLEIARVLAQDPTVIILDEATSALDAQTEYDVVRSISQRGISCIIIAHRLSTIRDCDEIIVLDRGSVVERGTHKELFALGGVYTALVTTA